MALFTKEPVKFKQEAHEAARLAVVHFEAETEKITTWLEAAVAGKSAATAAFEAAEAEAVAAVARGEEMPEIEPHRQRVSRAEDKVRTMQAAVAKREEVLKSLLLRRRATYKVLLDEYLRIEAKKLRTLLVAASEQNAVVRLATNAECGHPDLALPWLTGDFLENWDRIFYSFMNAPDGARPDHFKIE